jgi:hypothetical protein
MRRLLQYDYMTLLNNDNELSWNNLTYLYENEFLQILVLILLSYKSGIYAAFALNNISNSKHLLI